MYKSIAVFCGSKNGIETLYCEHAAQLGKLMGLHNIQLIYGGGSVGLMGAIANAVMQHSGKVIGIIPEVLTAMEQENLHITRLVVVPDMHARKKMMYDMCDAAIILPGGIGTLDELFEIYTWNNLKIHHKKIILLNTAGFYNALFGHLETMQQQGFLYGDWREKITIYETPEAIFDALDANKS